MQSITQASDLLAASKALAKADKVMAQLVREHGLCPIKPWLAHPFNGLINAIIAQQLSNKAADTIIGRTLKLAGQGGKFSATKLLQADDEALRACGLSGSKTRYVKGIAEAVHRRQIDLKKLYTMSDEECIAALTQLKGVGRWTVEMLLIFVYGHGDVLSLGDWGLRRGAQHAYQLGEPPNDKVFSGMAEAWRPYRSVASWYLWRAAEAAAPVKKSVKQHASA